MLPSFIGSSNCLKTNKYLNLKVPLDKAISGLKYVKNTSSLRFASRREINGLEIIRLIQTDVVDDGGDVNHASMIHPVWCAEYL